MIRPETLTELRGLLGEGGVEEHSPVRIDSLEIGVTIRPADAEALARTLAVLSASAHSAVIRGGGHRLGMGNSPRAGDVILSTERLVGVDVFEPAEGVCHVAAGTPLSEVRSIVNAEGWELPLDPPGDATTVGGTLAAAAFGPRASAWGPARDSVLGLELAHAAGERTRCGGRVVKNVTGYDLGKLYTGSFGTLAVIAAAWLRLRPLPEQVLCFDGEPSDLATACETALEASRLASARAVALRTSAGEAQGFQSGLVVELAGDAASVGADADLLTRRSGLREASTRAIDHVRELQGVLPDAAGLRFRIAALPSRTAALLSALHAGGAETLSYPGQRFVFAGFRLPSEPDAAAATRAFDCVAAAVAGEPGGWICESAPYWAKSGRDMHGDDAALLPIFEALKQQFDPAGVLNPGRFAGGL